MGNVFDIIPPQIIRPRPRHRRLVEDDNEFRVNLPEPTIYGWEIQLPIPGMVAVYSYPTLNAWEANEHKRTFLAGFYMWLVLNVAIVSISKGDLPWFTLLSIQYDELQSRVAEGFNVGISGILGMQGGYLLYNMLRGRYNWITAVGGLTVLGSYLYMYLADVRMSGQKVSHSGHFGGIAAGAVFGLLLDVVRGKKRGFAFLQKHSFYIMLAIVLGALIESYVAKNTLFADPWNMTALADAKIQEDADRLTDLAAREKQYAWNEQEQKRESDHLRAHGRYPDGHDDRFKFLDRWNRFPSEQEQAFYDTHGQYVLFSKPVER